MSGAATEGAGEIGHVLINGWFLGRTDTGSGQYLHHLLEKLPPLSPATRWTLLVPREPAAGAPKAGWPHVVVAPVPLPRLPGALRKLWWEQGTIPRWAVRLRADVLWAPYWSAPLWQPTPTVVTIHDLIPLLLPGYREGWEQRAYNGLVTAGARRAARIITVSHAAQRDIVHHLRAPAEQVAVVYHGPNQEGATQPDAQSLAAVRARHDLPARFFLYLGGFDARKNLRTLLCAYRRYLDQGGDPAVALVIAGRLPAADSPFAPDPRPIAASLGLSDSVRFLGWVEEADKPALYALSTGFLFPSLYEGFGMMVLEAQQAGAPVVTSK